MKEGEKNCLSCRHFDPLHFECNNYDHGIVCQEIEVDECLAEHPCSAGDADKALLYWQQRAVNAEAFIRDLKKFLRVESLRNMLPKEEKQEGARE